MRPLTFVQKLPFIIFCIIGAAAMLVPEVKSQSASTAQSASGALVTSGSSPVLSACGTSPTIRGNNFGGIITAGTGLVSSCTLTFVPAFATAPSCVASNVSTKDSLGAATTTTTVIISTLGVDLTSDIVNYICVQVP